MLDVRRKIVASLLLAAPLIGSLASTEALAAPSVPFEELDEELGDQQSAVSADVTYRVDPTKRAFTIDTGTAKAKSISLPAPGSAVFVHGGFLYVGCQSGDMFMYSIAGKLASAPALVLDHKYPHPVAAFTLRGGEVLVEAPKPKPKPQPLAATEPATAEPSPEGPPTNPSSLDGPAIGTVEPIELTTTPPPKPDMSPSPAAAETKQPTEPEAVKVLAGSVTLVEPNHVVIDLGSKDGLRRGQHVELYRDEEVDLGLGNKTRRHVTEAVGRVVEVGERRSRVELGVHELVSEDAHAISSEEELTDTPYAPKRVGNVWSIAMNFRPFLAWKARGGGSLTDAAVTYRFRRPVALHLLAEPVGFGVARNSTLAAVTAHGMASWDTRYFEFGAGLGWSIVEGNFRNNAFAVPQFVRIGAIDGVSVRVFNQFVLLQDRWAWGGTNAQAQFPIVGTSQRWWLEVAGGRGIAGYGFVEGGVKFLLWGGGAHNSFFLRGAAGYAQLEGNDGTNTVTVEADAEPFSHRGPMATFGFEWRPGKRGAVGRKGAPDFGPSHRYGKRNE